MSALALHFDLQRLKEHVYIKKKIEQQGLHIFDSVGICTSSVSQFSLTLHSFPGAQDLAPAKMLTSTRQKKSQESTKANIRFFMCFCFFLCSPAGIPVTCT